ncbi:tetratricopeptide repeat protein [uncultured Psychroserpens sp.]|uniref:tetratricopeptide repeat protein n=1 Tax=uncultured Psychroserpens sp. TaxID=255436 RepID=UPI00260D1C9A|nr:tetratricopeptide repeat protein [uncultured Psychroserpens sp.]
MTEEDHILIEKYLKGLLSKDEESAFLKQLQSDDALKEGFEFEQQIFETLGKGHWSFVDNMSQEVQEHRQLLDGQDMQALKHTIDKVSANQEKTSNTFNKTTFYYLAAASIVVLLAFQLFFNQNIANQDLYNDYINYGDLPSFATRSSGNEVEQKLITAQQLFEKGNYEESLTIFEPLLESEKNNITLYLYIGIAQTELKLFDEAATTFDTLITNNAIDGNAGHWYKALLLLKQDRVDEAKFILSMIVSKSLDNHEKAEALLSELNNE